ncbi:MAG: porin family protein [Chitinophagaceae bacterium]
MKKQILLLVSLVVSTIAMAQVKTSFGFRSGLSVANMQGDAVNSLNNLLDYTGGMVTTTNRKGFFAGAHATIPLSDFISVEPAVYYSQKGYELKGEFGLKSIEFLSANAKAQLTSHYIDIPVVLKANFGGFQLFSGPQVSYLTQADLRTTAGALGFNLVTSKMDATAQFNRWDVGFTGGIGYQFANGINIMATYDHGLSKADANQNLDSYNRAFKIGIGFSF